MSLKDQWHRKKLKKKARKGFRGFPVATVAYYGPNDQHATKVVVGIVRAEGAEPELEKWYSETIDVRADPEINDAIVRFIQAKGVKSVAAADRIIGCPHEEGVDYPEGEKCSACPFWANRDRFSGQRLQ